MTTQEQGVTRQKIYSELVRSPHGKLEEYLQGKEAAKSDPDFFGHLIAWNHRNGKIRDSKVALPLIAVDAAVSSKFHGLDVFKENALAHLALLPPRDLIRGIRFAKTAQLGGRRRALFSLAKLVLKNLEADTRRWNRVAIQYRRSLKELYAFCHVQPAEHFNEVLFKGKKVPGSVFDVVARLGTMDPLEAASCVVSMGIPFLVAAPALGDKLKDPDLLVALIASMTPSEINLHMKMFEKLGVKNNPATRGALDKALARVEESSVNILKMTQSAAASSDPGQKERILSIQEKKLDKSGVAGNWLVLADKSGSMSGAMQIARAVAGTLARVAAGNTHLVFFNVSPTYYDVTGKTLEEIHKLTQNEVAGGGTSVGCGVRYACSKSLDIDGIAIVSDGAENSPPPFAVAYQELCKKLDKQVPVYLYRVRGETNALTKNAAAAGIEMDTFSIENDADYYSLPNLIPTMRAVRYSMVDDIMAVPLLTLAALKSVAAGA